MKYTFLLPLAALTTAFVIPDEEMSQQLVLEPETTATTFIEKLPTKDEIFSHIEEAFSEVVVTSKNVLDDAFAIAMDSGKKAKHQFQCMKSMTAFDAQAWLNSADEEQSLRPSGGGHHPPHKGPGHGHHGHHGHHKHRSNLTVYQLIAKSKYTTKLAEVISEDEELVKVLNSTNANYTVFAPTDAAFKKIHKHHKKPSKELIKKVLLYHVSPEFYPAGRVLVSHTIPSLLKEKSLGDEPQRLRLGLGLNGLNVNFFSRIIAVNIFGSNGVIHGVDSIILPPPDTLKIIELFPGEYSTLDLGLRKTGLFHDFENTAQTGGTFFAPSNFAFQKLGPKINAFLFSKYGEKYLKAILKYHVISNTTLYSDAYYPYKGPKTENIPKGIFHVDLPTLLDGRPLGIDIVRFGGFIRIKVNGFTTVTVQDGIAEDGVIHIVSDVLIPPKTPGGEFWQGEQLTVDELMERLDPYVENQVEL